MALDAIAEPTLQAATFFRRGTIKQLASHRVRKVCRGSKAEAALAGEMVEGDVLVWYWVAGAIVDVAPGVDGVALVPGFYFVGERLLDLEELGVCQARETGVEVVVRMLEGEFASGW